VWDAPGVISPTKSDIKIRSNWLRTFRQTLCVFAQRPLANQLPCCPNSQGGLLMCLEGQWDELQPPYNPRSVCC
jgi:hypothetical protein